MTVPRIHVCSLSKVPETVRATGARSLVTLLDKGTPVNRPSGIAAERHLVVVLSDIVVEVDGHTLPSESHVENLLTFVRQWDQAAPLLIHCWAGVSRSTAAAFITACASRPHRDEADNCASGRHQIADRNAQFKARHHRRCDAWAKRADGRRHRENRPWPQLFRRHALRSRVALTFNPHYSIA